MLLESLRYTTYIRIFTLKKVAADKIKRINCNESFKIKKRDSFLINGSYVRYIERVFHIYTLNIFTKLYICFTAHPKTHYTQWKTKMRIFGNLFFFFFFAKNCFSPCNFFSNIFHFTNSHGFRVLLV